MKAAILLITGLCIAAGVSAAPLGPSGSLVSVGPGDRAGAIVGARYQLDRREFQTSAGLLDLDVVHVNAQLGYDVLPFLQVMARAGWAEADLVETGMSGEGGLEWGLGLHASLIEFEIRSAELVPGEEQLAFSIAAEYLSTESNIGGTDLSWEELQVSPMLTYSVSRKADAGRHWPGASEVALYGGLVFTSVDGNFGAADIEENRNFGYRAGAAAELESGWAGRLEGTFFHTHDYNVSLTIAYGF